MLYMNTDFNDLNSIQELILSLKITSDNGEKSFELINLGKYKIVFNGGYTDYFQCYLKEFKYNITDYQSIEVWITINDCCFNKSNFSIFNNCEWLCYWDNYNFGRNVPVSELAQIIKDIYKVSKLECFL